MSVIYAYNLCAYFLRKQKYTHDTQNICIEQFADAELKDLIQMVLHHPDFNADEVDHDMH